VDSFGPFYHELGLINQPATTDRAQHCTRDTLEDEGWTLTNYCGLVIATVPRILWLLLLQVSFEKEQPVKLPVTCYCVCSELRRDENLSIVYLKAKTPAGNPFSDAGRGFQNPYSR
jgi:hypothetical protein